jgi:cell wall-associated NlpC family hydrolase
MGGRSISINNIQPGDLIFYERNSTINHVGIYIGNGKVISASSPETGIRITAYNYRQPYKAVSYLN